MTIVTGDGTTIHEVVRPHSGWYPEADYTGTDVITIRDASGIAYRGEFTFKNGDWVGGHSGLNPAPSLHVAYRTVRWVRLRLRSQSGPCAQWSNDLRNSYPIALRSQGV